MNIKSFDDLDITDPIMFGLVFSNKHIAQPFIEHLLDIKIDHLETPIPEAVLSYDAEHKGVRYDVFARETNENGETIRSFDLEMQMVDTKELPQRARYYQSVGDGVALSKGAITPALRNNTSSSFVLWISLGGAFLRIISKTGRAKISTSH
ncbi:hypothetical protein SAMN05720470_11420 [Fibrobacter sp. UWOV1]|uniref:hypothetical protein n=1 Tax=Fibrobacter sp. UWOV1 TaxID=1896215 RepID=UPI000913449E|nr:hypothetical protein [Fibrobacter sp. UWOV1]SHL74279.1 hypothetical protein SAMN05720470_11420 [Fibrobacter sp. UWOV1]